MSGLLLKFSLKDIGAGQAIKQLSERIERPQRMLSEIGMYLLSSIQRNFDEQGRPIKWKSSRRAIEQHGQTLRDTGRLMNSITMQVFENHVKVGTNVVYAAIHHYGGTINKTVAVKAHVRILRNLGAYKVGGKGKSYYPTANVKAHSRKSNTIIDARPFMMIQDSDWPVITDIGIKYLIPVSTGE